MRNHSGTQTRHMVTDLPTLFVISDGAFPSGAFAHSFGLETAIDEGRVRDEATLTIWLRSYLHDGLATLDGAALLLAMHGRETIADLDRALAAATFAAALRAAHGRMALAICDAFSALGLGSTVDPYAASITNEAAFGHPALGYGLAFTALDVTPRDAFVLYATTTTGALAAVAARAVPLGQRAILRVRWSLRPCIASAFERARIVESAAGLHSQAYACEVDAMRHAGLRGRMFAS